MADKSDDVALHARSAIRPSILCFYDAAVARKENTISEDDYLQALVAHCTGIRHGRNQLCNGDTKDLPVSSNHYPDSVHEWKRFFAGNVVTVDVFAWKVSQFIAHYVSDESKQVNDTGPIVQALKGFLADDAVAFRVGLNKMDDTYPKRHERPIGRPSLRFGLCYYLATISLHQPKIGVLHVALESTGNQTESVFHLSYNELKKKPGINQDVIRAVDESGWKSSIPPGESYHPWL